MPIGIGSNPYVSTQAFPGAADKGSVDPRELEKRANTQVENQSSQDATAVPTRRRPVEAKSNTDRPRLEQDREGMEAQRQSVGGGTAQTAQKGGRINIYA